MQEKILHTSTLPEDRTYEYSEEVAKEKMFTELVVGEYGGSRRRARRALERKNKKK